MTFLDEVHAKRQKLAAVLVDEDYSGIRAIVEELYPDRAHFLFELLQNAEDAGATEVSFDLRRDMLVFEHDGRPFDDRDVWGITNIGKGTKRDQEDKIGRFGVGFKAIFAYSETPHIWSPTFCFKITDLVLPTALAPRNDLGKKTRFEFPFNNPKKAPADAFQEVEAGLRGLAETTILFLTHLRMIHWNVGKDLTGKVYRTQHSAHHVEVVRESNGKVAGNSHFLKFDQPVKGLEKQRIAVAFALDWWPNVQSFDAGKPLAKQLKIIPAAPGRVAVFFPAEKEISGLRLHLHAPFVPELSRASIKETPANLPLFAQLGELAAACLHQIRDLDMLTADFLEVLPNKRDQIGERYNVIRSAIIEEMNDEPLTPTHARFHAPAKDLLKGKASLKSLLSDEDLEFLIDYEEAPPRWAIGITQRNSNADRFLDSLAIRTWDVDNFVALLRAKASPTSNAGQPANITPQEVQEWLRGKNLEWHQELYALLLTDHLAPADYRRESLADSLGSLKIVRLTNGTHGIASECFFVTDGITHDEEELARVEDKVYTTGKSKSQKENAKALLKEIGVREIGEAELVEAILKKRYTREAPIPDEQTYLKDLKRFVELVERDSDQAKLFEGYFILQGIDAWWTGDSIFLDQPFLDTGLSAYYDARGKAADRAALNHDYLKCGISLEKLVAFALAVGASKSLAIEQASCWANPYVQQLVHTAPGNRTHYCINVDYVIAGLDGLLPTTNAAFSKLIWKTLCEQDSDSWTTARYRNNSSYGIRTAPSQLACILRDRAWVPQTDGRFVRPAEATRDMLPSGFPFDAGWKWLSAIGFGKQLAERSAEEQQRRLMARQLGFGDDVALDRARRFAALPAEEQQRILAERETRFELPDHEPTNPTRRAERVTAEAATAPKRQTEERTRSVSVNRDAVKQEAGQYLCQQYTNTDGQMMCQICKKRLPFQLDDGSDYFERVEFLPTVKRHHKQNYLALCPNHAAMFQHANGSSAETLRDMFADLADNALPVVLAKEETTIYFTKTHLADLKAILRVDERDADPVGDTSVANIEPEAPAGPADLSGRPKLAAQK